MSGFLLPLDELDPTLTDVLAFIDDFQSDDTTSTSNSSEDGGSPPRGAPSAAPAAAQASPADCRKTRKAAASRRCQQKKRAELLALRAQVVALESRLQELEHPITHNGELGRRLDKRQRQSLTQLWVGKARLERQLRRQSEDKNRELKTVLARQSRIAQAVQNVLSNVTAAVHIEEALRTPAPTNTPSVLEGFVPNLHDAIYAELSARLGRLHVDVGAQVTTLDNVLMKDVSNGVQVRRDAVTGVPYVELNSAMRTNLDLHRMEQVVMNMKACHYIKHRKYLSDVGIKKESEFELRDQEMAVALNTLSLSRSYEDENRLMLTFSSLVCEHPTDIGMRFRDEGFVLVTRSPSNPQAGTVIQISYRLTPDVSSEPFSPTASGMTTQDTEATKVFVLQHLGEIMWKNFQTIQANCVEAQFNPAAIPAAC